jgi:hypothetical protein
MWSKTMRWILSSVTVVLVTVAASAAEPRFDGGAAAKTVGPFLDEQTFAVGVIDLSQVDVAAFQKFAIDLLKPNEDDRKDFEAAMAEVGKVQAALAKAGARHAIIVTSLEDIPGQPPLIVIPLADGADSKAIASALKDKLPMEVGELHGSIVVAGAETMKRLRELKKPVTPPGLAKGFDAVSERSIRVVAFLTPSLKKAAEEIMPTLPKELGGSPVTLLTRDMDWLALGCDLPPKLALDLQIQCQNEKAAKALAEFLESMVKQSTADPDTKRPVPEIDKLVQKALVPTAKGDRVVLQLDDKTVRPLLFGAFEAVRIAAERQVVMNSVWRIGAAMHKYASQNKDRLPPAASLGKDNKPVLSWRVQLLPYLGEEKLYKEFKLDEPWDSEHNKKLIVKMPAVYRGFNKKLSVEGKTPWVVPVGKSTMFPPGGSGIKLSDVTNGLSNTIMVMEADDDHSVVWTKPEDLEIDVKEPTKGLANSKERGVCLFLHGDGSVRVLFLDRIDKDSMNALFTKDGGDTPKLP